MSDEFLRRQVLAVVGMAGDDPFPHRAALRRVADLNHLLEGVTRMLVLDRRVARETWDQLAFELGVNTATLRQRFTRGAPPRPVARRYQHANAYYDDGRRAEGRKFGWDPQGGGSVSEPAGSDEGWVTDAAGQSWRLTICTPALDILNKEQARRLNSPDSWIPVEVVATRNGDDDVALLHQELPYGTALRALASFGRKIESLDHIAGILAHQLAIEQASPFWQAPHEPVRHMSDG